MWAISYKLQPLLVRSQRCAKLSSSNRWQNSAAISFKLPTLSRRRRQIRRQSIMLAQWIFTSRPDQALLTASQREYRKTRSTWWSRWDSSRMRCKIRCWFNSYHKTPWLSSSIQAQFNSKFQSKCCKHWSRSSRECQASYTITKYHCRTLLPVPCLTSGHHRKFNKKISRARNNRLSNSKIMTWCSKSSLLKNDL